MDTNFARNCSVRILRPLSDLSTAAANAETINRKQNTPAENKPLPRRTCCLGHGRFVVKQPLYALADDHLLEFERLKLKLGQAVVDHIPNGHHAHKTPAINHRHVAEPTFGHAA